MADTTGALFVVATPIGNLGDLTQRAGEVLAQADAVAAEDTRRTGRLLSHLGLRKRLIVLHEHNEEEQVARVLAEIHAGGRVALVSDAGTPLISDPGYRLVRAAREQAVPVVPVPGACAAIAALSVAGLPSDRFLFEGFLPARAGPRQQRLIALAAHPATLIFYEAVHRIDASLAAMANALGPARPALVARELTKLHESFYAGSLEEVRQQLAADPGGAKGEFTVVVGGAPQRAGADPGELKRIMDLLLSELPPAKAAGLAARITGARRSDAYALAGLPAKD